MQFRSYRFLPLLCSTAAIVLAVSALGASLTWMEDTPFPFSWKTMRIPKWSHGALIAVQNANDATNPLIWIAERQRVYSLPFEIPGAGSINVYDWDRSFDGTRIALSGSAIDTDGRADFFVAWISSDGTNAVIRRTSRYIPRRIAIAADGTLWTAGQELNGPPDAGVFRHFDRTGKPLGAFVPRSSFPDPIVLYDHTGRMRAAKDRVVWYSPRGSRYMEISLQGAVLADISVKPPGDAWNGYGFGLTDRGDAFLSSLQYVPPEGGTGSVGTWKINILDKSTAEWKPVLQRSFVNKTSPAPEFGHIYGVANGVNGDTLVLTGDHTIRFYKLGN